MVDTVRTEKDIKIALHSFTVLLDYNDITDIRNFELPPTAEGSTNSVTLQTNKGNAKLTLNWLTKGDQLGDLEMVYQMLCINVLLICLPRFFLHN